MSNTPAFGISNCIDLYFKLKYDFENLTDINADSYRLFDFLTTGKHILEWVINDKKIEKSVRDELGNIDTFIRRNKEFKIINSLCNSNKHFVLDRGYEAKKITDITSFDFNDNDFNNYHFGKTVYLVEVDGELENVYGICKRYFEFVQQFFQKHSQHFIDIGYLGKSYSL